MKLRTFTRVVGALCTLWSALVSMELPGVHACAVHSPGVAGHHASHSHGPSGQGSSHKAQCTCPGTACGSTPASPPRSVEIAAATVTISSIDTIYRADEDRLPDPLDFRTQLPNAPPTSLTTSPATTA